MGWRFDTSIGKGGCRFMCVWDTTPQGVRELVTDLESALG